MWCCPIPVQPLCWPVCTGYSSLAVQRFPAQPVNGRHRWLVPLAPLPNGLGALYQQLQQPQFHVDLFQLYEEAVAAGGLSAVSTPMTMWRHMATRGVAGVPGNCLTGEQLRMVSVVWHALFMVLVIAWCAFPCRQAVTMQQVAADMQALVATLSSEVSPHTVCHCERCWGLCTAAGVCRVSAELP